MNHTLYYLYNIHIKSNLHSRNDTSIIMVFDIIILIVLWVTLCLLLVVLVQIMLVWTCLRTLLCTAASSARVVSLGLLCLMAAACATFFVLSVTTFSLWMCITGGVEARSKTSSTLLRLVFAAICTNICLMRVVISASRTNIWMHIILLLYFFYFL